MRFDKEISNFTKKRRTIYSIALLFFLSLGAISESAQITTDRGIAVSAAVSYRDSWAVVIGINRYSKAPRLNYAVNDAQSVVAAVQQLGFASDKILLLLDQEATKQRIEQVLYGTLRRTSPDDRVLVFFAGHGLTTSLPRGGDEGFLLPVDGDPEDLPLTAIAMEDVRKIARRIPAKHILFAVDACYSGFAITRDAAPAKADALYLEAVTKEPAVQIITAGRKGEQVLEEEGHGLFTRRMLSGLTGLADMDQNGIITAQELATWLETRVVRDSQDKQHPQYSRLDGEGQFVFVVGPQTITTTSSADSFGDSAEQLKRERALLEDQRKLYDDKLKVEMAKLDAERVLFRAERERLDAEKARNLEERQELERRRKAEEASRVELAKVELELNRFKAEEDRLTKERSHADEVRLELERRREVEAAAKATQPQAIAKLTSPTAPPRPVVLPVTAQLPKYSVGDSWTVKFADGRTSTRSVRAVEKDQYVFDWGLDLVRYYDLNLILKKQITPENGKDFPSRLEGKRFIDFPLSVNKTWEFRVLLQQVGGGSARQATLSFYRVFNFKVLGSETIQIPGGAFGAFKIEESSYEIECASGPCGGNLANTTIVRHIWYAPEVKSVVKIARVSGALGRDQEPDYELAAFDQKGEGERLDAERRQSQQTSKASEPQAIAKLTAPLVPARPLVLPTVAELPKYSVGDSWTVKFADGRTSTRSVRAVEKDQYVFEWGLDLLRYYDRDLILRRQITPENGKEFPSYLEKQRSIDFPLAVNKTWEFRILVGRVGRESSAGAGWPTLYYQVFAYRVLGTESIQTVVGTFGAFKIEESVREIVCRQASRCDDVAGDPLIRHLWYAPEVKSVVKIARVSGALVRDQEPDYELAAFELK